VNECNKLPGSKIHAANEGTTGELQDLQRSLRDLVALSTLPAVWAKTSPLNIVGSLAELLQRALSLNFVYVHAHRDEGPNLEAVRTNRPPIPSQTAQFFGQTLSPWLRCDAVGVHSISNPCGSGTVRVMVLSLGHGAHGFVAAGSARPDFPSESEQLLLRVGTNQAEIVLERRWADEALRESQQRLQATYECAPVGIAETSVEGKFVKVNEELCRTLGYNQDELLQRSIEDVTHPEDSPLDIDLHRQLIAGEIPFYQIEKRFVRKDGSIVWTEMRRSAVRDAERAPLYTIGAVRDITERKQAQDALRDADRRKDEFLAMLAHELRNPLAPIRNAITLLERTGPPDQALKRATAVIQRQSEHLTRLVDDLLDVSRITQGKIKLQKERIDLITIIARAVEVSRPMMDQRKQQLTVSLSDETVMFEGDLTRLSQVVSNLLNNASKYSEDGGQIWISAKLKATEMVLRIRDTGIGIPPDFLPHVFELFTQADRSLDRSHGGLGIGLTLVRALVQMHGGTVEAHSDGLGHGSEFVVRLPVLTPTPQPAQAGAAHYGVAGRASGQRILIVDDNVDAAESMSLLLQLNGHEVMFAQDGSAALALSSTFHPKVILLDIGLPGLDGYSVAQKLRKQPETRDVMLIALTGYGQPEDRERSKAAGFDYHLVKPVDHNAIENLIDSLSVFRH
jgi:PAS domain S-box-containing protein